MNDDPKPVTPPSPSPAKPPLVVLLALAVGCLAVAIVAVMALRPRPPMPVSAPIAESGVMRVAGASIGGPFQLTDHSGRTVSEADFAGRFMLIYFGFTHCPDICPTELQVMANAVDALGGDESRVVPIFITVDPQRDTVAHLKDYVAAFHPKVVGLTGNAEQIAAVAKAYKVYFSKQPGAVADTKDYQVDHTSFVYLMGPDGVIRSVFRAGTSAKAMAGEILGQLRLTN